MNFQSEHVYVTSTVIKIRTFPELLNPLSGPHHSCNYCSDLQYHRSHLPVSEPFKKCNPVLLCVASLANGYICEIHVVTVYFHCYVDYVVWILSRENNEKFCVLFGGCCE